jgi:hypothetical protein
MPSRNSLDKLVGFKNCDCIFGHVQLLLSMCFQMKSCFQIAGFQDVVFALGWKFDKHKIKKIILLVS